MDQDADLGVGGNTVTPAEVASWAAERAATSKNESRANGRVIVLPAMSAPAGSAGWQVHAKVVPKRRTAARPTYRTNGPAC
jgi:hypothetical protein